MTLKKYHEKRKFDQTPEPKGQEEQGQGLLRFVVQMHQASRLHYDFRLELEGTLKSWAVPKGPSLDPEEKRLAVMVEDHPLDYRSFEGVIPKGNYGAGQHRIWDEGSYKLLDGANPEEQFEKGKLKLKLDGKKLKVPMVAASPAITHLSSIFRRAPIDWAASSMRGMSPAASIIDSIGAI